jgi:hypothetical protein
VVAVAGAVAAKCTRAAITSSKATDTGSSIVQKG